MQSEHKTLSLVNVPLEPGETTLDLSKVINDDARPVLAGKI